MNIERHYKILGLLWFMFGVGISVVLAVGLFQFIVRFGFDITNAHSVDFLIMLPISFLTFLSGWALFKRPRLGRIAIFVISLIHIAYGILYILFVASEVEGIITPIIVMSLLVLGLYSFFFLLVTGITRGRNCVAT